MAFCEIIVVTNFSVKILEVNINEIVNKKGIFLVYLAVHIQSGDANVSYQGCKLIDDS